VLKIKKFFGSPRICKCDLPMKKWLVYICYKNGILYTGITTNIRHRMSQHKAILLYQEEHCTKEEAAKREKQIKGWSQKKKMDLIKGKNLKR